MARLSRDDWTGLALAVLAEEGPSGLTVARVCARAGRTRGSLYHHFENHDALLFGVLERWRREFTEAPAAAHPPGEGASAGLHEVVMGFDFRLEQNVRRLVAQRDDLRSVVEAVDEQRIAHLARIDEERGASAEDARMRAEIEYAAFLGIQQLDLPPTRLGALFARFDALWPRRSRAQS